METRSLTITLPLPIYLALEAEGAGLGESASEVVKNGLRLAYKAREGWTLKLLPPPPKVDPNQTELPLTLVQPGADE